MPGPLRVDWEDALPDLEAAAAWSLPDARRLVEYVERFAALGWSPGRATDRPGVLYLPIPPLGVLYELRSGTEFHIIGILNPRRLDQLPPLT